MNQTAKIYPTQLLLVAAGGGGGTAMRYGLSVAFPGLATVLWINIVGAFILGLLTGWLSVRGFSQKIAMQLRLFIGTGMMGGFTTYSTFAVGISRLATEGDIVTALLYGILTVCGGISAAFLGTVCGRCSQGLERK
ncbi:CrcB family protein [Actinomycetaceae bacterium WB03_NA08]|uniref:Fluoride-specific ion channel FluC n=1 Tax=Scrofimicrobium canadense TaxID=2652290 RepID=A0A6N7VSX0_9ACTO|nr:CrcB family protein [Scrofimicrobium canadense]MSS84040.1 CrcB family protein [Scrofimicrobium canadense]